MKKTLLFVLAFLLIAQTAHSATNRYVNPNGTCGGSSPCYTTIQGAADVVNAGDVVIVQNGTYTDTNSDNYIVRLLRGGNSGAWITFRSENKWGAVLDGQTNATDYCFTNGANANYINIEDFEMKECGKTGVNSNSTNHHITIHGNKIHKIGRRETNQSTGITGVFVGTGTNNITVDSNWFYDIGRQNPYTTTDGIADTATEASCTLSGILHCYNHDHAVYIHSTSSSIINNISGAMQSGWFVQVASGADTTLKIINNTAYGSNPVKAGQIMVWGSSATIENNIFASPRTAAIICLGASAFYLRNNISSTALATSACAGLYTSTNNQTSTDPLLVSTSDYHLQITSPAIDAGLATNAPDLDYDGVTRTTPDIGAYESDGEAPTTPGSFTATTFDHEQIDLEWTASTDDVAVTGYRLYRGGGLVIEITDLTYSDVGLNPATQYNYTVTAVDASGNESAAASASAITNSLPGGTVTESYTVRQSGGDYTTMAACVTAKAANLVTGDKVIVCEADQAWSADDTTAITDTGYTTGVNNYLVMRASGAARHQGKYCSTCYRLNVASASRSIAMNDTAHFRIEGLQIKNTYASGGNAINSGGTPSSDIRILDNIIYGATASAIVLAEDADTSGTMLLQNNVIYGLTASYKGILASTNSPAGVTLNLYNNTIYGVNSTDICISRTGSAVVVAKNNIVQNCATGFSGTFDAASDYNMSSGDAPGAHSLDSTTAIFRATNDYQLHYSSQGIYDGTAITGRDYDVRGMKIRNTSSPNMGAFEPWRHKVF